MNPRDRYRKIADRCRAIPGRHGLREHTIVLVHSKWSGASIGDGEETSTEYEILCNGQPPKVRFPDQREIALGQMSEGSLVIGPFTPDFGSGGIDRSLFDGSRVAAGETLLVRVTGPQAPNGTLYRIRNPNVDHALHANMICVPAEA